MIRSDLGTRAVRIAWLLGCLTFLLITGIYIWCPTGIQASKFALLRHEILSQARLGEQPSFGGLTQAILDSFYDLASAHIWHLLATVGFLFAGGFILRRFPHKLPSRLLVLFCTFAGLYVWSNAYNLLPENMTPTWSFWLYLALKQVSYALMFSTLLHLVLVFPGQKGLFNRPANLLLGVIYTIGWLPPFVLIFVLSDLNRGLELNYTIARMIALVELAVTVGIILYKLVFLRSSNTYAYAHAQVRWLLFGSVISAGVALVTNRLMLDPGFSLSPARSSLLGNVFPLVPKEANALFFIAIPLIIGVMVPRYRILNIDFIINRSLVYSALALIMCGLYLTLVAILDLGMNYIFPGGNAIAVQSIALLVVLLGLVPLRKYIQSAVDHIFYPTKLVYQRVLSEALPQIIANVDIEQLSLLMTKELPRRFQISGASLLVMDHTGKMFNLWGDSHGSELTIDHPLVSHLMQSGRPLLRFLDEPELSSKTNAYLQKYGIELCIPLFIETRLVGIYNLGEKLSGLPYMKEEIGLLTSVKQYASIAIDNARIYSRANTFCHSLEERCRELTLELDRVTTTTESERSQAKQEQQTQTIYLGNVNREIRAAMTAIDGLTAQMLNTSLNQQQGTLLQAIRSQSETLYTIVNNISDYLIIESGKLELNLYPSRLGEVIEGTFKQMAPRALQKKIGLTYTIEAHCPAILIVDPTRLSQILLNLLDNAIKFTHKGRITVEVDAHQFSQLVFSPHLQGSERVYTLHFTVKDTGIGITKAQLERLFKSSGIAAGAPPESLMSSGAGLGLLLSKRLCEFMGGALWAESDGIPGRGSIFSFAILAQAPEDTFPVYMDVEQPQLKDKRAIVLTTNPYEGSILISQLQSWGIQLDSETGKANSLRHLSKADKIDLAFIDLGLLDDKELQSGTGYSRWMDELKHMQETLSPPLIGLMEQPPGDATTVPATTPAVGIHAAGSPADQFPNCIVKPVKADQLYNIISKVLTDKIAREAQLPIHPETATPEKQPSEKRLQKTKPEQEPKKPASRGMHAAETRIIDPQQSLPGSKGVTEEKVNDDSKYNSQVLDINMLKKLRASFGQQGDMLISQLIAGFNDDSRRLIDEAHQALESAQNNALLWVVRQLYDNSTAIGAIALSTAVKEIEQCALDGKLDLAAQLLVQVEAEYDKARISLEAINLTE